MVVFGEMVDFIFIIFNFSCDENLIDISFMDDLDVILFGLVVVGLF